MNNRLSTFVTTNPATFDGKARIYRLTEVLAWPPPEWLIDGWIPRGAMSGLYGAPGTGKSMLALDWALSVSTGRPWLNHSVQQGYVLYIAAEGHSGQAKRALAWLQHQSLTAQDVQQFGFVKERIAITESSEDYDVLFSRLEQEVEREPTFVIIDTLARSIQGDENESLAMGLFLNAAERWIEEFGATVLVIHHGNAAGTRERGHTSFKGTLGALFRLSQEPKHEGLLRLTQRQPIGKQRDAEEAADIGLRHEAIEGTGSVILVETELPPDREKGHGGSAPMRKVDMLKLLAVSEDGLSWREWRLATGISKDAFNSRIRRLLADSEIYKEEGRYYVYPANVDVPDCADMAP